MASLRDVGQQLKEAREAQNLALEDVAAKTHISNRHLLALEEGNESDLPELFYIRGFLKKYAEVVGLSPNDVADAFKKAPTTVPVEPTWRYSAGPIVYYLVIVLLIGGGLALAWHFQPKVSVVSEPSPSPSPASTPSPSPKPSSLPTEGPAVAVTGSSKPSVKPSVKPSATASAHAAVPPASARPSAASSTEVGASPRASATAEASPKASIAPGPLKQVVVDADAKAWVEVAVDGQNAFRGTMAAGSRHGFKGHQVEVRSGNAGGVHVRVDGQDAGVLGKTGAVVTKTF